MTLISSSRAISSASAPGKHVHGSLRTKPFRITYSFVLDSQSGGRPSVGADIASHVLKIFIGAARAIKKPGLILFLDLNGACYNVIRTLLIESGSTLEGLAMVLNALKLP